MGHYMQQLTGYMRLDETQCNFIYQNVQFVCYTVDIRGWDGVVNIETRLWAD